MNILDEIAERALERVDIERARSPLATVRREAEDRVASEKLAGTYGAFPFEAALAKPEFSFICEVKRASPSKGVIAEDFDPVQIAREYEAAGADAISCLTEPFWFMGSKKHLAAVVDAVSIPVLRKDFTVDEYMIYQAKALGASAVLLICSILDDAQLKAYGDLARELGMSALVEAHDADEIRRGLDTGARILGVNNRNLKDFSVDLANAADLRAMVPSDVVYVSESGVSSAADVRAIAEYGADAALIGECLMRSSDKAGLLAEMKAAAAEGVAAPAAAEGVAAGATDEGSAE